MAKRMIGLGKNKAIRKQRMKPLPKGLMKKLLGSTGKIFTEVDGKVYEVTEKGLMAK